MLFRVLANLSRRQSRINYYGNVISNLRNCLNVKQKKLNESKAKDASLEIEEVTLTQLE